MSKNSEFYTLIARALRDSKPQKTGVPNDDYILLKHWNITVESMAYELEYHDAKFHRNTFLTECGYLPK